MPKLFSLILVSFFYIIALVSFSQQQQLINSTTVSTCNFTACNAQRTPCSSNRDCECFSLTTSPTAGICAAATLSCTNVVRCNADNRTCPIENTVCVNSTRCGQPVCYPLALANKLVCPRNTATATTTTVRTTVKTTTTTRAAGLANTTRLTTNVTTTTARIIANSSQTASTLRSNTTTYPVNITRTTSSYSTSTGASTVSTIPCDVDVCAAAGYIGNAFVLTHLTGGTAALPGFFFGSGRCGSGGTAGYFCLPSSPPSGPNNCTCNAFNNNTCSCCC